MPEQLAFHLPSKTARGREDFLVAPSNAMAAALIDDWQSWPGRKLLLTGPAGSGKTHLAHVWAAAAGAQIIDAGTLKIADVPALAGGPVAAENVDRIAGLPEAQTALFHLHNLILAEGHALLMTGTGAVTDWGLTLPDLQSRLQGATEATLEAPDDALLSAVIAKLLSDRQIAPNATLIPYLVARMPRSFDAARRVVDALDAASLAKGSAITRQLAGEVLDKMDPDAR